MAKGFVVWLIIGLLFITACQPELSKPSASEPEAAEPDVEEPPAEEAVAPAEPTKASEQESAQEVAPEEKESVFDKATIVNDLLQRVREKVKSYSFSYGISRHHIIGNKIRVDLADFERINKDVQGAVVYYYISSVFLDPGTGSALGYCDKALELEMGGTLRCTYEGTVEVDFSDYYAKPPLNWLDEFKDKIPTEVDTKEIQIKVGSGYKTSSPRLTFSEGGVITKIYIEKFSALPYMVEQTKGSEKTTYDYKDLVINSVKEGYVIVPG